MPTTTATKPAAKPTSSARILDLFRDVETANVRELVTFTGLSKTTVNTNLKALAEAGDMIRMDVDGVATWQLTPTRKAANKRAATKLAKAAAKAADVAVKFAASQAAARKPAAATKPAKVTLEIDVTALERRTTTGRRVRYVIDTQILAFLDAHPDESFGAYTIANSIGASQGAAYVATRRMGREGVLAQTSDRPVRWQRA